MSALAARPTVGSLVVPYMVDASLRPIDFKALDMGHIELCATRGRCGVCGAKLRRGPVAFIGPADDGRDCFADPWMHVECAQTAMRQCPFLIGHRGWRAGAGSDLLAQYAHNMVLSTATAWRAHRDGFGNWHFQATAGLRVLTQGRPAS